MRAAIVTSNAHRPAALHGVALGTTPSEARQRFQPPGPGPGSWRSFADPELVLVWSSAPSASAGSLSQAPTDAGASPAAPTDAGASPAAPTDAGAAAPPASAAAPEPAVPEGSSARFEFHGGLLVALRLVVPTSDPDAKGPGLDVSTATVLSRRGLSNGRVELTLLARDCPTHATEVRRLLDRR